MSPQIAVLAPATRVMSRKLGPTCRRASPCSDSRAAACEASTFASTCGRWLKTATSRSWVSASTATGRAPTIHQEAVQALVQQAARLLVRREVPDRVLEQVGARVLHAGGLGTRDRVAAHEARVRHAAHEVLLRRAHVRDERVLARRVERRPHQFGQHADGRAGEARAARPRRHPRSRSRRGRSRRAPSRARAARDRGRSPPPRRPRRAPSRQGRSSLRSAQRRGRRPSHRGEVLAGQLRRGLELAQVCREVLSEQRLRDRRRPPPRDTGAPRR